VFFLITVQGARLGDATVAANALLLNGLLLTAYALDGLAHAVEALCGHAIGGRDRVALRRSLLVASGWSLLASLAFVAFFAGAGQSSSPCKPTSPRCARWPTSTWRTSPCCR
jgi:MATE family multidrug resistance protein